jgi:hypothetical protein
VFKALKVQAGVGKLVGVILAIVFIVHVVACLWHWICDIDGYTPDTWIVRYGFLDKELIEKYQISVYWAFTTLTTVGYGDISALTYNEKVVSIMLMVFGCAVYSYLIGNLQGFLNEIDVKHYLLTNKLDTLLEFSKNVDLPDELLKNITRYIVNNANVEPYIPLNIQ